MKVLNLQCPDAHQFEGWFASELDYEEQLQQGLLECPMCGAHKVHKLPSAPRLNLGAVSTPPPDAKQTTEPSTVVNKETEQALQAAWLQVTRQILAQTEDVGARFADEARRMHYGETEERGIRGQASREETDALREEGIKVMPLVLPDALKGPLH